MLINAYSDLLEMIIEEISMPIWISTAYLTSAYLVGSIPWGYLIVKLFTGKNIQNIESGRTGGTNTMRAAGFAAGLATTVLDILKSAGVVWIGRSFFPQAYWLHVIAALLSVLGHNYSIFLLRISPEGKIDLGGGAGGTPTIGGLIGFWWPVALLVLPIGAVIIFVIGYASLATMTMPLLGSLILAYRAIRFGTPWEYAVFGLLAEVLILWALRPNIKRLIHGSERVVGLRAKEDRE